MKIQVVDNSSQKLLDVLERAIVSSEECKIAVAFASADGISLLKPSLLQCLQKGGYVEFLLGLDLLTTEPQALWILDQMSRYATKLVFYCFKDLRPSIIYHPKLYLLKASDQVTIIIGSSNLTEGGLKDNIEINACVQAGLSEEIVSDVYAVYNLLKFHPHWVKPDQEFLSLYEDLYTLVRKRERAIERDNDFKQIKARFQQRAKTLKRPIPTVRDLFGWQRLVYEKLPEGQFRNQDIYRFEEEFKKHYPENKNVRAKIRQVLQQLRDLKLVKHLARETWIKESELHGL